MSLFEKALSLSTGVVEQLKVEDFNNPTPCSDWDVRALVGHMVYEIAWVPDLVSGKTIDDVGKKYDGDLLGDDPIAAWEEFATKALVAVHKSDPQAPAHLSYGDKPAGEYSDEVATDLIIHAWDLAKALGVEYSVDDDTANAARESTKAILPLARKYNLISPALEVDDNADGLTKLLAAYGRSTQWQA